MDDTRSLLELHEPLRAARARGHEPPRWVLHRALSPSKLEDGLEAVARSLAEVSGGELESVSVERAEPPDRPALTLCRGTRDAIHYLALPEGPEAAPFREAVLAIASPSEDLDPARGWAPTEILVFIAPQCPNCPHAVRAATSLAAASSGVTTSVIDATRFPTLAERFAVRSVPTLVIDGSLTLVGALTRAELVAAIEDSAGARGEVRILRSMLDAGRIGDVGQALAAGRFSEAFAELWLGSAMEARIALLLAADDALEIDPSALDSLAAALSPALSGSDTARRGDTADLLGKIAHPASVPALDALLGDPDADVAEAAADALEAIASRSRDRPR